jgi:hypothetical protein
MTRILTGALALGLFGVVGCEGQTPLQTGPLTDEQKAQIKAEDKAVDDAEKSGAGTAVPRKRK